MSRGVRMPQEHSSGIGRVSRPARQRIRVKALHLVIGLRIEEASTAVPRGYTACQTMTADDCGRQSRAVRLSPWASSKQMTSHRRRSTHVGATSSLAARILPAGLIVRWAYVCGVTRLSCQAGSLWHEVARIQTGCQRHAVSTGCRWMAWTASIDGAVRQHHKIGGSCEGTASDMAHTTSMLPVQEGEQTAHGGGGGDSQHVAGPGPCVGNAQVEP